MKQDLNCRIVQDLMQSYLDEVTSEYTSEQMEAHMEQCKDCAEYCNKLKHYEKLRADDAEYIRAWHRKVKRWTTISIVSILLLSSALLYLFIPRKIEYKGTYTEYISEDISESKDVKITLSYKPGMELFRDELTSKFYAKIIVKDMQDKILWEDELKNWYYYLVMDERPFANTMFFYYSADTNQMELANLFFDEAKENFLIQAEYFEISACTTEFKEQVEEVMHYDYE